jgi:hypothetical protein
MNPGFCDGRQATNHLNHGTAFRVLTDFIMKTMSKMNMKAYA